MTAFYERPDDQRMAALRALDAIGPCATSYTGIGITVTIPRGAASQICAWAKAHGLDARDWYYFPLGTDRVPEVMRHDGNYPGSRGFHLYVHCVPTSEVS